MTVATIQKWGNSQGIRIPRFILDAAKLSTDEMVEINVTDGKIVIRKAVERKKSIEELFEGFDGEYNETEIDWGKPVGNEIW
ncbi:MAG: AbrB/MazE/SpoVT family DNA-binding domain-containing protein [Ruminococcus sp.]|nr:AbrB/MazE/SpoVT family DNA-binding domain-containing protein [Ruminococcus sp.]